MSHLLNIKKNPTIREILENYMYGKEPIKWRNLKYEESNYFYMLDKVKNPMGENIVEVSNWVDL